MCFKLLIKKCWLFLPLFLFIFSLTACTVLQWRENDTEIYERFSKHNIKTSINYYLLDSLNLKIRSQHITDFKSNLNLVFLHGSPSSLSAWNKYLTDTLLVKKANLHAIDRPGYGYSKFGEQLPEIDSQAYAISQLLNYYKLNNVIAIGSSYGGPLVARLAVINANVKGVIMISPAIDPSQEKDVWGSRLTQWKLTRWMVPVAYRVAGDEKAIHAQELKKIESEWDKVSVPVMHIHGNADDLVPYTNINYTKKRFTNIEIITTPNTGHEIAWSRPDLILPHIYKMMAKLKDTLK